MMLKTPKRENLNLGLLFIFLLSFLTACKDNGSQNSGDYEPAIYRDTTGPINTITIVADTTVYAALMPTLIQQDYLGKPLPASLIPQSLFGFRNFSSSDFDDKKTTRIVINIKKGDPNYVSKPSLYAKNQAYIEIYGNDVGEIKEVIAKNKSDILNEAERANFSFLNDRLENDHKDELSKLGVYMKIPAQYNLVLETPDYQWYRLDKIETLTAKNERTNSRVGTQTIENFNVQVGKFPMEKNTLSVEEIKSIVNGYGLNRLKGDTNDEYLTIQQDLFYAEPAVVTEKYTLYDFDGMWEMKGAFYGGSFLGRIIIDKSQHELYFSIVSMNAPNPDNKRDNVISALTMVKSFKVLKSDS